jgi:enoyl-CoA hydratase
MSGTDALSTEVLRVERADGVAVVTLDRPDARNALSKQLRDSIALAFRGLQLDEEIRAVVLTGEGKSFCAGFDLKELSSGESSDPAEAARSDMQDAIAAFDRPIIGAIGGTAITGGFELALACDILIAGENARFADTHARVGMLPGWGLSQKLPRMIGISRAKEVSLAGNFIDAEQALAWGLVNRVVPNDELVATCVALAKDIASCVPSAVAGIKKLIDDGATMTLGDALAMESEAAERSAKAMLASTVGGRREAIRDRGRKQQ